jgi:hypothetical protein
MMGHPAEQTLLAYMDRELPFDERSTVREHVQMCVACSRMLDELAAATRSLADAVSTLDVPAPALLASELEGDLVAGTGCTGPGRCHDYSPPPPRLQEAPARGGSHHHLRGRRRSGHPGIADTRVARALCRARHGWAER